MALSECAHQLDETFPVRSDVPNLHGDRAVYVVQSDELHREILRQDEQSACVACGHLYDGGDLVGELLEGRDRAHEVLRGGDAHARGRREGVHGIVICCMSRVYAPRRAIFRLSACWVFASGCLPMCPGVPTECGDPVRAPALGHAGIHTLFIMNDLNDLDD